MPPERPSIMDIEASGFGAHSYPIEVGIALDNGLKYCALLKPDPRWTHWDSTAEALHGISRAVLLRHGRPLAEVARQLNEFIGTRTVYSDGWVVDNPWLKTLYFTAGLEPAFHLSPLEAILDEAQMADWHAAKESLLVEMGQARHRASFDAYVVQETYWRTRRQRRA